MQTFYFNTGVKPIDTNWRPHHSGTREIPLTKGQVWRNGTKQIPFDVKEVPEGATFDFGTDLLLPDFNGHIIRETFNTTLGAKYAYFKPPFHWNVEVPEWLFIGVYTTCYIYCDTRKEVNGDYKEIGRIFYSPVKLEIMVNKITGYEDVIALAEKQAEDFRRKALFGEGIEIRASGQTVQPTF